MRVLVTGASGFIGAYVCRALRAAGCDVGALVRPGSIPRRLISATDDLELLYGDMYEHAEISQLVQAWEPEACIHLAWYVETGKCLHSSENIAALNASFHLIQILAESGCKHVITAGTCAEYDTNEGWLRENSRTKPETLYAASKLALNLVGQQLAEKAGMRFTHARIFYVYGPNEDSKRVVPGLIKALHAGRTFDATPGAQVRDYLHVEDVAQALTALLLQQADGIVNIASGVPTSIHMLMDIINQLMGSPDLIRYGAIPYRAWDPMFICGDASRLCGLGWKPRYSLESGLAQTVDWWRDNMPYS